MEGISTAMTDAMVASMEEGGGIADTTSGTAIDGAGIAIIVVGIAITGITTVTTVGTMIGATIAASGKEIKNLGYGAG